MRGEGVGQAEHRGELGAEQARAEDPERHMRAGAGHGATPCPGSASASSACSSSTSCGNLGAAVGRRSARTVSGRCRARARARGRCGRDEARQRPESARRSQRRVVGQHDAASADPDRLCPRRDVSRSRRRSRRSRSRPRCGARRARSAGNPDARRGGRGRASSRARRRVAPSTIGARSRMERASWNHSLPGPEPLGGGAPAPARPVSVRGVAPAAGEDARWCLPAHGSACFGHAAATVATPSAAPPTVRCSIWARSAGEYGTSCSCTRRLRLPQSYERHAGHPLLRHAQAEGRVDRLKASSPRRPRHT